MTIRRLRNKSFSLGPNLASDKDKGRESSQLFQSRRSKLRQHLLEALEPRQMLAAGPQLIGVQPNNSDLIENGVVRNIAPKELTFRFDDAQVIDAATTGGIRVTRAGGDGSFSLPSLSTDFGTSGKVDIQLTGLSAADQLTINVTRANLGAGVSPTVSINGSVISLTLNSTVGSQMTAQQLVNFINTTSPISGRLSAKINGGIASTLIGSVATDTYSPLKLTSTNDIMVAPGAVIIGDHPNENEVTLRFAENLPDDNYRLEVFGFDDASRGITGLRNTNGQLFQPSNSNTRQDTIDFRLDLGSKVTAVVPQPIVRNTSGQLEQQRDTIVVYFDNDKLLVENDSTGKPTARSVENPDFYQLIYTADTVRNTDDATFYPKLVRYNASSNTATLTFQDDLDLLPGSFVPSSSYRLRIGTRETTPLPPVTSEAAATAITDMNTNGAAKIRFTSKTLGEAGSGVQVVFINTGNKPSPVVTVSGTTITVDIGSATATIASVVTAIKSSAPASALVNVSLEPGSDASQVVGNKAINYSPTTLYGLGSTFDTSTNLGTIGSAAVPQTSLLLTSTIDAQPNVLDSLGAPDDLGQRDAAEGFENHINPAFGGDNYQGIRTIYYNFQANYGTDAGNLLINAITDKEKDRVREVFSLWSNYLGVQFVETANLGLTIALGNLNALNGTGLQVQRVGNWGVAIDPTYSRSLAVFSANITWGDNYGESFTRSSAAAVGMLLGLSNAGDLDPSELLNLDSGFLNFPTNADRNFEPVFPGNQDIINGQYIHRPEGSDIDLYRFDVNFGPNGESREGVFVAETLAERLESSSPLDTRLALYKQTQATAVSNLGAGQGLQVSFTAVQPGKLGNNLQIFVTRSNRGANALPIINAFSNIITIDLNSTIGSETTVAQLLTALDQSPGARALVTAKLVTGAGTTVIGNRDITYSPITLHGGSIDLISQNDNYFGKDSLIRLDLSSGVYYVGVSASGNDAYDPTVPGTGTGGRTQGKYELRLTFRAQTDSNDSIQDVAQGNGDTSVALDGDADGNPGGVYNFWFQTRPLDRTVSFNAGGSAALEGQVITVTGGNGVVLRFEFSSDTNVGIGNTRIAYQTTSTPGDLALSLAAAINSRADLGVTAIANGAKVTLRGERLIQIPNGLTILNVSSKTIFVDKSAGPNADGSLAHPFNNIAGTGVANAFAATLPGDIVRIVGNGGSDGKIETVGDNFAYEIGFGLLPGSVLSDGSTMDVPKGVTVMIDAGAVFKLRRARIGVGSTTLGVDRSGGALEVLGAPILTDSNGNAKRLNDGTVAAGSVYFTSWLDQTIGLDNYAPVTTPAAGDWGGLVFKRDLDKSAGRFDLEDEGIFRQYVNHADIRYGGSSAVVIDSIQQTVNAIQIADMRPTVSFNRITNGADAAVSATPDSFKESLFSDPFYQRKGVFTPDYTRVGPEIHDNLLVNNSINGMFVKVTTPAGGDPKELTVAGRFDDVDITHVIAENVVIEGNPGGGFLDTTIFASNLISLAGRTGGVLTPGTYNYKLTFVDRNGYETVPTDATQNLVLPAGQTAITMVGLPGVSGEYVSRRLYRSDSTGGGSYHLVAELDGGTSSFTDLGKPLTDDAATLLRDRPNVSGVTMTIAAGGTLATGNYTYRVVMIDAMGRESLASAMTSIVTTNAANRSVRLNNLPATQAGYVGRRIYRSAVGGAGTFTLVAELKDSTSAGVVTYLDNGSNLGTTLSPEAFGNIRPRLDASLTIDPGIIVKLEGARIEVGHSAQLLAEGVDGNRVVFTSKQDDRFGIGGTFDTNNNGVHAAADSKPGDWSGIYASPGSTVNFDHAVIAYAGGISRLEGTFKAFSPLEIQQANARIANSTFENNANGMGGQGPIDRFGRPANENYPLGNNASRGSTVFIRGAQPVVLNNIFQNNAGSAMTIDANSMDAKLRGDSGRQSGLVDRDGTLDSNRGPLFRRNQLFNNSINGLEIRADAATNNRDENTLSVRDLQRNVLTTESVWDDTDIVHVLFDSIVVSNLQHSGGLRLQSAVNESLVIKMDGQGSNFDQERGTGFTATGTYGDTPDRVGGTVQVIGQPGFPVIFTSLRDDTVGAGTQPDGLPQTDTNNDGIATVPRPGDWRSLLFLTYSNDRAVSTVMEIESPNVVAPGSNDNVTFSQYLGALAPNASNTDENLPLGYAVHGVISEPADQDVYSFNATAGTQVWIDIDNTSATLDTVLELLDANGQVLARSDNSTDEQQDPSLIYRSSLIDPLNINPLIRKVNGARTNVSGLLKDDYTFNVKDAGMSILLPGVSGTQSTYFFRIRSKGTNIDDPTSGLTRGSYDVQVRLQDKQEFPGSVVQYADIRYATNGVQANGLPSHSPLTGEAKVGMYDGTPNDAITDVGSLQYTDKGAISVAGTLNNSVNRIGFSVGGRNLISPNPTTKYPVVIDLDYADGLNRPDTSMYLWGSNVLYYGADSNIADDQPGPLSGSDLSDLTRGSIGTKDPFIGTIGLTSGNYELAVAGAASRSVALGRNTVGFDDSLETLPFSSINTPQLGSFAIPATVQNNFNTDAQNFWHATTAPAGGHGGTAVYGFTSTATKSLVAGGDGILYSRPFSRPTTWETGETVRFSFNYQFTDGGGTTPDVATLFYNTVDATGQDGPKITLASLPTSALWRQFSLDISSIFLPDPTATIKIGIEYNTGGANPGPDGGMLVDDFYMGVRTPRYAPIATYTREVDENFEGGASSADTPVLFAPGSVGTGANLWHFANIGPDSDQNHSGTQALAFSSDATRSMADGAVGDIVSENIDLSNERSSGLYFAYDFNPHDSQEQLDVFIRVAGKPDTLVASSRPGVAGVNLERTQGQWDQARVNLASFDGQTVQLVFRYDTKGPNAPGTGDRGYAFIDDIVVGTKNRGEQIVNIPTSRAFVTTGAVSGDYQVELRKGDDISSLLPRYYRGSYSTSLQFDTGLVIPDHSVFVLSDGANQVSFEFTYDGTFAFGNAPINISATLNSWELAQKVRDAINQMYTQSRIRIKAASSNGTVTGSAGQNSIVNLFGNVDILSGKDVFGPNGILNFNGFGDQNVARDQGQFLVTASTISDSRDYAVWSAPADKYYADGTTLKRAYTAPPSLGGAYARNLPVTNTVSFGVAPGSDAEKAGTTVGMVVTNNVFTGSGLGGLHIEGDTPVWRITAFPGANDSSQTDNAVGDHAGSSIDDGDILTIDYGRNKVNFEFEDIAGGTVGAPVYGSAVVGGNGWFQDNIPIYYREDTGGQYERLPNTSSGYAADEVVKAIRDSINGSILVTNGTTQNLRTWVDAQTIPTGGGTTPILPSASIYVKGPQSITSRSWAGGQSGVQITRVGGYTASPFVRAVNNTIFGNDGTAPFNAVSADVDGNDTIAGATETWQGVASNPISYTVNGTLNPDPLSTGSSDVDLYKFHLEVGERVLINVDTTAAPGLDSALKVFDSKGRAQTLGVGNDPTTSDNQAAPGETLGADPYVDFTATVAGDYYAAISASGNTTYDPLSLADRLRGKTSGSYKLTLNVLKPQQFVISVDDPSTYADGETFTISQVPDLAGTTTNSKTFEFTTTGAVQAGNIPIVIGANYRVPDVARAIAGAINAAGLTNAQTLDNGRFGTASPLAPVSAIALGGIDGFIPTSGVPAGNGDVGINSGNSRGAEIQAGLARYQNWTNDQSPFDLFPTHAGLGMGHDRSQSGGASATSLGNGTTEKYVIIRNASHVESRGNIKVDPDLGVNSNLNNILGESGILISGGAAPTLLNNVFVNVQTPIVKEEAPLTVDGFGAVQNLSSVGPQIVSSMTNPAYNGGISGQRPSAVIVGGSIYQYIETKAPFSALNTGVQASPTNIPNTSQDFNFTAAGTEKLFVDAPNGNFLPAPGSRVIDSSIDSLPERQAFGAVKNAIGIAPSPILAPDRDNSGQLRADDPSVAPPSGLGGNVFKDRGALDRADFIGPSAATITPIDNDAQSIDKDPTLSVMQLTSGVYPEFRIQLKDGFETSNLQAGTGINDDTVVGRTGTNRLPGSVITITENGRLLVEGIDYVFSYNTTTNEIVLKPLAGIWKNDRVYDISLNNKDRFVIDAPAGDQVSDGNTFQIKDSLGGNVTFEYDSGFRLQLPQGIELDLPLAGGGAGGVTDGDRFVINNGANSFTFEFDSNNNFVAGNIPIPFNSLSTKQDIANSIVTVLTASVTGISPRIINSGDVYIGAVLGAYADTTNSPAISQPRQTTALLAPDLGTRPGGITDGQTFGVSDGRQALTFEFDSDRIVQPGNIRVDISSASTAADVAQAIKTALDTSGLALATQIVAGTKVYLGLPNSGQVDVFSSNLSRVGVSRALSDGQTIVITRTSGSVVTSRTFELTTDGTVGAGNIPVQISVSDTQSDIGVRLTNAIKNSGLGLSPQHVGNGNIFVGGTSEYSISVANAPTVGLFGRPGVQGNTKLDIFGTLLLQVPARGGADLADNSTFTISNNSQTVTFEFDSNFSGPTDPNNVVIRFSNASTASDIVGLMLAAINGTSLNITARDAGLGRIDLGLLANSAVNVRSSGLTISRGSVADGDFFTINNGTQSVTFEFENLSIGNGRVQSRTPIRYNNQSTRADIFAAMKAAIESSSLGLTTVIESDGLKLLDNARYVTNIDNAPSLSMTGVAGGSIAIPFIQDQSFTSVNVRDAIIDAINKAFADGKTSLQAKVRGGSTLFVENAVTISSEISSYFLRGIADNAGNFLRSNRINNETQFTILMPGVTLDYGDAPDPVTTTPGRYPTKQANDGARHVTSGSNLFLGSTVDSESDGKPTPNADGDAGDDGVSFDFQGAASPTFNRNVDTTVTVHASAPGVVDAWIDFNADGDWEDPGEHILDNVVFTTTTLDQSFTIRVPATAPVPATAINSFARFRISTAGHLLPTGLALDGEVEDYQVRIIPGTPPTGVPDTYNMNEDQVGGLVTTDPTGNVTPGFVVDDGVLANDINPDGKTLSASVITPPANAQSFTLNSNGTFTYRPRADFYGVDTFVYQVNDGSIKGLAGTTVTINVRPVNDAPTAGNLTYSIDENGSLVLADTTVLAAGTAGPANESNQTLTIKQIDAVSVKGGSINYVNGQITYTPPQFFAGNDSFTYTIVDNGVTGNLPDPLTATGTISITVRDKNNPPVTAPKTLVPVAEDGTRATPVANFLVGDVPGPPSEAGQTLTFVSAEPASANGGTVTVANGVVTYKPAPDFNGTDFIYYHVVDNGTSQGQPDPREARGTATIVVTPVNDAPRVVKPFGTVTMVEDENERALALSDYFFDPDVIPNNDVVTYAIVSNTNTGLVAPTISNGSLFIKPKADQNGSAVIVVRATDAANLSVTNTVTLTVTPVDDAPRLVSPLPDVSINEDAAPTTITLTPDHFYDPDVVTNGDVLTFAVTNSNPGLVTAVVNNGKLTLTLVSNASGQAIISVKATDVAGNNISDSFVLNVAPVNDPPTVVADSFTTPQGTELRTTDARGTLTTNTNDDGVLANDSDLEGNTFTATISQQPTKGTVTLNADGTFSYIPFAATLAGAVDTFTYIATDSLGAASAAATVTITIGNPPPPRHQNHTQPLDVNADGFISPIDALIIINFLNASGTASVNVAGLPDPPPYRDVNGDNFISPLDVLAVINYLNRRSNGGGEGGEGEGTSSIVAAPYIDSSMVWSSNVLRETPNAPSTLGTVETHRSPANAAKPVSGSSSSAAQWMSLQDYLAGIAEEDEISSVASLVSKPNKADNHQSVDSVFADIFGTN